MDNPGYVTLSRQTGLLRNLEVVANNLANVSTVGFRREGAIFAEVVERLDVEGGSTSQSSARARATDFAQGALRSTGGTLDLAIEGDGFFMIETREGQALSRAGSFSRSPEGEIVTNDGLRVLDEGGAPLFAPPDAERLVISSDGIISAGGQPIGQVGLVTVEDTAAMTRRSGGLFETDQAVIPAENATLFQGFVEQSNVDPVRELTRMIDVQRAYEMGQSFLKTEDERMRQAIRLLGQNA